MTCNLNVMPSSWKFHRNIMAMLTIKFCSSFVLYLNVQFPSWCKALGLGLLKWNRRQNILLNYLDIISIQAIQLDILND